ncbi:MAG: MATE family efflux transporter [Firmicutes bacterium]|nr:MATE family efflux transporter [Bacillota bacterium]
MKEKTLMTSGSIGRKMLYFSIPLILGNLFQQLYNLVDSVVVGQFVGDNALAAVGAGGSIIQLLIGFIIGASAGAGVVTSQYYGAQDHEGVRKAVHTTLAISIVCGIIVSVMGVLATPWILHAMGTPEEVFREAEVYLKVFFAGHFFAVIYNLMAGILNAVGNSKRSLIYLIIAAVSNMILDILFVAVFDWGVIGAALATDLSQAISCVFILHYMHRSRESYQIRFREIRFYDHLLSRIIRIGIPTGIQNIVVSFSNVFVQTAVNSFGATVMAAYAAFNKIDGFILLPILSLNMAATTFAGQNYGAQKYDRIHRGLKISIWMGVIYSVAAGAVMLVLSPYLVRIFTDSQDVIDASIYMMYLMYPFYWILGIFHIALGTIRGVGKTFAAMVMSLVSLCAVRILWISVTMEINHSLALLVLNYPFTWLVGAMIIAVYIKKANWLDVPKIEREGDKQW